MLQLGFGKLLSGDVERYAAARDLDYGIVVISDCCYSHRGNNNAFFLERVFPRMGRVMTTDAAISLMGG